MSTEVDSGQAHADGLTDAEKEEVRGALAALKASMPGFRTRRSQAHMIAIASRTFGRIGGSALVEAPTGTGKSLSYLAAGVPIAQARNLKLVVSTGTVALQEQLAQRDIPAFLAATKFPATVVLAKGRGRYACTRDLLRLASAGGQEGLDFGDEEDVSSPAWDRPPSDGEIDLVGRLAEHLSSGKWNGDLDNPPEPIEDQMRSMITTTAGACANKRCAHYSACPFIMARRVTEKAQIVVTNHAMLLADLSMAGEEEDTYGGVVLPKPSESIIVIDEGHHLPDTARDAKSVTLHANAVHKGMRKLRNVLRASYQALNKETIGKLTLADGLASLAELDASLERFEKHIRLVWQPDPSEGEDAMWRAPMGAIPDDWMPFVIELLTQASTATRWVRSVRRALMDATDLPAAAKEALPKELGIACERLENQAGLWSAWSESESSFPVARWISVSKSGTAVFHAAPISAADFLRHRLFDQAASVLVTSATLSAGGDFADISRDLGLPDDAEVASLPSPFDLHGNGELVIPAMKASPKDREAHAAEITQWLLRGLDWGAGNLVLFTSKAKMNLVYKALPPDKQAKCLVQGAKSKAMLMEAHAKAVGAGQGSTLFGVDSFGTGLDLPGKLCETVVITNLPFAVPTDPVQATLAEWLESKGRRPFDEVSIPAAIRTLTQNMGRLLRHENDKGRIVVLDRRLADTSYGKRMLRSLPGFRRSIER